MRTAEPQGRTASVSAGIAAGVAGFATFLLIHHVWIVPIWFIAPVGVLMAAPGGAAVGAAYADLVLHLPGRPWTAIAVAGIVAATLLPAIVIGELRGPIFANGADGGTLLVSEADAAVLVVGSLAAVGIVGAGLGALIDRSRRAAGTMAVAALAVAIGPGHNIPLLGGTTAVAKELLIIAAVIGVASVVLVEGHARLPRGRASTP